MVAIDLGSNTIRMIEFDCKTKIVKNVFEKIVKTADKLYSEKIISDEAIERIIQAIEESKSKLNFQDEVIAYTTEAIRQAENRDEVIQKIEEKTSVKFQVITPEEEAYFTSVGVANSIKLPYKTMLLVDIGGGSTEIILKNKNDLISESFKIGIVTISEKYKSIEALEYGIKKDTKKFKDFIKFIEASYAPDIFVASSGTPTTIAALKIGLNYETYDPQKVNGVKLTINDLDEWKEKLLKMEVKKREQLVGIGRGNLIVSGILIFKEIFKMSGFKECIVSDDGVREGIAIDYCKNKK